MKQSVRLPCRCSSGESFQLANGEIPSPSLIESLPALQVGGQALVELMIALALVILLITGFMAAMNAGLSTSTFATNKALSIHYAREGLEMARIQRNIDWDLLTDIWSPVIVGEIFTRDILVVDMSPNKKQIVVEVSWETETGQVRTVLATMLTNWK